MVTEEQYFDQWAQKFTSLVGKEAPYLSSEFTISGIRDERGCIIPELELSETLNNDSSKKERLNSLWRKFLTNNPY